MPAVAPALDFSALALLAAWVLDATLGEPPARLHPVVWLGRAIRPLVALRTGNRSPAASFLVGGTYTLALSLTAAAVGVGIEHLRTQAPVAGGLLHIYLLWSLFALKGLLAEGRHMARLLQEGDLSAARQRLSHLCSRDAKHLGTPALAAASIESLAENTHDSVVAPLCFYALGGLPALAFYRVVNTLDAMVGYRDDREHLGKLAARLDDVLNFLPARLSTLLLALSGISLGCLPRGPWLRDTSRTDSPNAGWPMALISATLGVRLDKPGSYILGVQHPPPTAAELQRTVQLVHRAGWLAALLTLVFLVWHGGALVRTP